MGRLRRFCTGGVVAVAEYFNNLPLPAALYWLVAAVLVACILAAGFDYLMDQLFPENDE